MRLRKPPVEARPEVGPFLLKDWLPDLECPSWCSPQDHKRHMRNRAYVNYLKARRGLRANSDGGSHDLT